MSVSLETLERRLSDLDRCYRRPIYLDFNRRSTVADPILSASWKNSVVLNYRAGLTILDVEADILSKGNIPNLRANIASRLHLLTEHVNNVFLQTTRSLGNSPFFAISLPPLTKLSFQMRTR
jgi:hypothetical protein